MFKSILTKKADNSYGILRGTDSGSLISVNSNRHPVVADHNQVLSVAPANGFTVTITPPAGEFWRIKHLFINIARPVGSTSGTHEVSILEIGSNTFSDSVVNAKSNFGDSIIILRNALFVSSAGKVPASEGDQIRAITNIVASSSAPLRIFYYNGTNVEQTGTLNIRVAREVEYVD